MIRMYDYCSKLNQILINKLNIKFISLNYFLLLIIKLILIKYI